MSNITQLATRLTEIQAWTKCAKRARRALARLTVGQFLIELHINGDAFCLGFSPSQLDKLLRVGIAGLEAHALQVSAELTKCAKPRWWQR